MQKLFKFFSFSLLLLAFSCASYKKFKYITEEFEVPSKLFGTNFNQTWQAVLQVMRTFDLETSNQEAGIIKTRWIDNTNELNFSDSFGTSDAVKSAKFKLIVNVVKGYRIDKEVSKVTIYKRQLIEQDFLQGWKEIPSDGIQEKTLIYRINKVIAIDKKLREIEKKREEAELKNF